VATYIMRPRQTLVERFLTLTSVKTNPEKRAQQSEEVIKLRSDDAIYQETHRWLAETVTGTVSATARGPAVREAPLTGTIIADLSDDDADRMRRELPEVLVMRDEPIELIPPARVTATARDTIDDSDRWHLQAIGLTNARSNGFGGTGAGITISVLDTGVDPTHPELNGKVVEAVTFDARPDVWAANPITPSIDTEGHGTHVSGLVCGETVGVAPGARILNGVMIPGGNGNVSDFVLALEWTARRSDVQIVNMSAGIRGFTEGLLQVVSEDIRTVGILPVFATGNEGHNKTRSPGNYIDPISVGATNRDDRVASFSSGGTLITENHQYTVPDLVAPGEGVYSSVIGGGYEAWDGTSMATPVVAGVAALILEKYPDMTLTDLEDMLRYACKDLGFPPDRQGAGLVQVPEELLT
jgi:subtilisin family serine protease